MNPFSVWRGLGMAGKIVVGVVAAVAVGVALWAVWNVVDAPRRAREAEIARDTATAYSASSKAAIDTIVAATERDEKTKEKIIDEVERIQKLPVEERYGASITLLCGLREYHSDPRCAELR